MRKTQDYTFEVSLSKQKFDHKPTDREVKGLRFKKTETDVTNLLESILYGYCYAAVFSDDSFGMDDKDKLHFRYSYLVSIDVDHSNESMSDMVDRLEYKPTFAYASCNDGMDGESRFRLGYCFDDKIESINEYEGMVLSIFNANGLDINEVVGERRKETKEGIRIERIHKYDRGSKEAWRYYNGNGTETFDFIVTDIIYSKEDFCIYSYINSSINSNNILLNKQSKLDNNTRNSNSKMDNDNHNIESDYNMNSTVHFVNKEFEEDYWNMKIGDILSKYIDTYPNIEHTPLPSVDDDTPYILFPKDYIEINRRWNKYNGGWSVKLKDGQGRRNKLFVNGVLRRRINPNITFDNLIYNLLFELYYYVSNYDAKNIIGKKEIFEIAKNVMDADLSLINAKGTDRNYMVNPNYCIKHNLSKQKVNAQVAKELGMGNNKKAKIDELYDYSLTDKENAEMMKEKGFEVSEKTIYRWRKENGITKYMKK